MQRLRKIASMAWHYQPFQKLLLLSQRLVLTRLYSCRITEYRLWKQLKSKARFETGTISKSAWRILLSACAFSWAHDSVSDEELEKVLSEMEDCLTQSLKDNPSDEHKIEVGSRKKKFSVHHSKNTDEIDTWDILVDKSHLKVWRRPVENSHLYEYRAFGSYDDITAREFFNVQEDLPYRCQWDNLVIKLEVIDKDPMGESEVVQWITHYPYPMKNREYLFVRRSYIDPEERFLLLRSRAVPSHPLATSHSSNSCVRVTEYASSMLIVPHGSGVDENGVDYVLTYFDNPQSNIPTFAYNWIAGSGVFDFMEQLHQAAKERKNKSFISNNSSDSLPQQPQPTGNCGA